MSNINALIRNQFLTFNASRKQMVTFGLIMIIMPLIEPSMIAWAGGTFVYAVLMTVIAFEFRGGIDSLIGALPVKVEEYILSRYLFALINLIGASLISVLLLNITSIINSGNLASIYSYKSILFAVGGFAVITIGIVLPVLILVGPDKARVPVIILTVVPLVSTISMFKDGSSEILNLVNSMDKGLLALGMVLIGSFIIVISYFVTLKIYKNKEV